MLELLLQGSLVSRVTDISVDWFSCLGVQHVISTVVTSHVIMALIQKNTVDFVLLIYLPVCVSMSALKSLHIAMCLYNLVCLCCEV